MLVACVATSYGSPAPKGAVIATSRVSVVVPRDSIRVSTDNPHQGDLVMYEDFSGGIRGLVFLVQSRDGSFGTNVVEELRLFSGPEASLLDTAEVLESNYDSPAMSICFLVWLPPDEVHLGTSKIIHREALYMLGTLEYHAGRTYRIQVAWNPIDAPSTPSDAGFFDAERARALKALEEFRRGVTPGD